MMQDIILTESGIFWWNNIRIEEGRIAPEKHTSGTITIHENGKTTLELNGLLSEGHALQAVFNNDNDEVEREIQGVLRGSEGYVLLTHIRRNGANFSSNGLSYENFIADRCLKSSKKFPDSNKKTGIKKLTINIDTLDEWLNIKSIKIKSNIKRKTFNAKYSAPKPSIHKTTKGTITVNHDMVAPWTKEINARKLELEEKSNIEFAYTKEQTTTEIIKEHQKLESFLTVITGHNVSLPWPKLKNSKDNHELTLYFQKQNITTDKFNLINSPVKYSQIKECIGQLYCTWVEKHEILGPGFYLYLSVIKIKNSYIENQYANLIWGLESLHRKTFCTNTENTNLKQKIDRILQSVDNKDRRWLKGILDKTGEPSLKERIEDIFSTLPINFESQSLSEFCKSCADRRNDISHFGGQRHDNGYDSFIDELIIKTEAIKYLYRAKILQEIGVDSDVINYYLTKGMTSHQIKRVLDLAKITLKIEKQD